MDKQIICLTSPSEVENPVSLSGRDWEISLTTNEILAIFGER